MKKLIIGLTLTLGTLFGYSQEIQKHIQQMSQVPTQVQVTQVQSLSRNIQDPVLKIVKKYSEIQVTSQGRAIVNSTGYIELDIPYQDKIFSALVYKTEYSPEILTASGVKLTSEVQSFRGILANDPKSLVSISIDPQGQMYGFISTQDQLYTITKLENQQRTIVYSQSDLILKGGLDCASLEVPEVSKLQSKPSKSNLDPQRCIQAYWETKYDLFQLKGSAQNLQNYIQAAFNQVQTLYLNDGINIRLKTLFINDLPDTYPGPSTYNFLTQFQSGRPQSTGDVNILMGTTGGGGIAYVNSLCTTYDYGYCMIGSTFNNVPVYSWTIMVLAHEQGHILGSPHTHNCSWTINGVPNQAIDGCAPSVGYGFEGTCNIPSTDPSYKPLQGGTIMSYCHLTSVGINLSLGFGPLPKALILDRINTRGCVSNCDPNGPPLDTCWAPENLVTWNLTSTSAKVTWNSRPGTLNNYSYSPEYKTQSSSTWIILPSTIPALQNLSSLTPSTQYNFRVKTNCTQGTSGYSSTNFSTLNAPPPPDSCRGVYKTPGISIQGSTTNLVGTRVSVATGITNQGSNPGFEWFLNTVSTGAHTPVYSFTPNNLDQLYCTLTNPDSCFRPHVVPSNTLTFNTVSTQLVYISCCTKYNPDFKTTQYQLTSRLIGLSTATYEWRDKLGILLSTLPSFNTNFLSPGIQEFTCTVTSSGIKYTSNTIKIQ